jgi:hypothetical protein
MRNEQDYWTEDDFEDTVASALIACFETKFKKNRGAAPSDRLTEERIQILRREGPYIASNSRLIMLPEDLDHGPFEFDIVNDRLPLKGLYAYRPVGKSSESRPNSYLNVNYIRQVQALGRYWHKRKNGTLYEMLTMSAENDGVHGERRFFTVTARGEVVACTQRIPSNRRGTSHGEIVSTIEPDREWLRDTTSWGTVTLQMLADKRHCWTITAQEKTARMHLGSMMEEVKSLLYARSLPMTATGRKRPILHLVESHKRRMRNGTDIDVTAFLRGQQTVEIGGTVFNVNPPATLQSHVSKPSRERYFNLEPQGSEASHEH